MISDLCVHVSVCLLCVYMCVCCCIWCVSWTGRGWGSMISGGKYGCVCVSVCLCGAGGCGRVAMTCTEAEGGRGALTHTRWCDCLCSLVCVLACVSVSIYACVIVSLCECVLGCVIVCFCELVG